MRLSGNRILSFGSILVCAVTMLSAATRVEPPDFSVKEMEQETHLQIHNKLLTGYKILKRWQLPEELLEISANVLIDENRVACIADNKGIIYIYNLKSQAVEDKIEFAGKGDFEGLALVGDVYYALTADGMLFEISGGIRPIVIKFDLPLGVENDTESLFYDKVNSRLLISPRSLGHCLQ